MLHPSEEQYNDYYSDDEVFIGKFSMKEFKKRILNNQELSKTLDTIAPKQECETSLQLIQTHSQPNLRPAVFNSPKFSSIPGSPALDNRKSDESFIQMENMVSKLCLSPGKTENLELNNTLDVIEYILNNGPNQSSNKTDTEKEIEMEQKKELGIDKICSESPLQSKASPIKVFTPRQASPNNIVPKICESLKYFTPAKSAKKQPANVFITPSSTHLKSKTPTFKTPANPLFQKKPSASSLKTPNRSNAYQHITSPIATYIKNCPQAPLVRDVHPRKPLPGPSSIPKFSKNPPCKIQNKENINLPSIAYKSAKKTKVIHLPDEGKLPQSQWVKKITSTLPRPTVMKHENREMNFTKRPLLKQQEDSFANLSCQQAEVSICTQKTAFKSNRH